MIHHARCFVCIHIIYIYISTRNKQEIKQPFIITRYHKITLRIHAYTTNFGCTLSISTIWIIPEKMYKRLPIDFAHPIPKSYFRKQQTAVLKSEGYDRWNQFDSQKNYLNLLYIGYYLNPINEHCGHHFQKRQLYSRKSHSLLHHYDHITFQIS